MQVYIYYRFDCISDNEISIAKDYFENTGMDVRTDNLHVFVTSDEAKRNYEIEDDNTFIRVILGDLKPLIEKLSRDVGFECTVDTSFTAGEMMDVSVAYKNGEISLKKSDWYIEECMKGIESYEDFCDCIGEYTEEEYEMCKGHKFVYIIEADNGDYISDNIPLREVKL